MASTGRPSSLVTAVRVREQKCLDYPDSSRVFSLRHADAQNFGCLEFLCQVGGTAIAPSHPSTTVGLATQLRRPQVIPRYAVPLLRSSVLCKRIRVLTMQTVS
jgi:hypothetical protein